MQKKRIKKALKCDENQKIIFFGMRSPAQSNLLLSCFSKFFLLHVQHTNERKCSFENHKTHFNGIKNTIRKREKNAVCNLLLSILEI